MIRTSVLISALWIAGAAFADDVPLSFKGIELGKATEQEVKEKFPGAEKWATEIVADARKYSDSTCGRIYTASTDCITKAARDPRFRIGDTSSGTFYFAPLDGTIEQVRATFANTSFPAVLAAFEAKYGSPSSTAAEEFKTKGGASFSITVVTWKRTDGEIVLRERAGSLDKMSVEITTPKYRARTSEEFKRRVNDAAKDL